MTNTKTTQSDRGTQQRRINQLRKQEERLDNLSRKQRWKLIRTGKRDGELFQAAQRELDR